MSILVKMVILYLISLVTLSSAVFASNAWKDNNYFCKRSTSVIYASKGSDYININFEIQNGDVTILDGTLGVTNGKDKYVKTMNKKATFVSENRPFGFILQKKNTNGFSNHLIRFLPDNKLNITTKQQAYASLAYWETVQWLASCSLTSEE